MAFCPLQAFDLSYEVMEAFAGLDSDPMQSVQAARELRQNCPGLKAQERSRQRGSHDGTLDPVLLLVIKFPCIFPGYDSWDTIFCNGFTISDSTSMRLRTT